LPSGALALASSNLCTEQAFRIHENAYGLQFHIEMNQKSLEEIFQNPEAINYFGGADAISTVKTESKKYLEHSLKLCQSLTKNFLATLGLNVEKKKKMGHGKNR
jgi:GMP synthase (glutamine-hydrolysing)